MQKYFKHILIFSLLLILTVAKSNIASAAGTYSWDTDDHTVAVNGPSQYFDFANKSIMPDGVIDSLKIKLRGSATWDEGAACAGNVFQLRLRVGSGVSDTFDGSDPTVVTDTKIVGGTMAEYTFTPVSPVNMKDLTRIHIDNLTGSCFGVTRTISGQADDWGVSGSHFFDQFTNDALWIEFTYSDPELVIDTPIPHDYLPTGSDAEISGTCAAGIPLTITYTPLLARTFEDSAFDVECTSGGTFSSEFEVLEGEHSLFVVSKRAKDENILDLANHSVYINTVYIGTEPTGWNIQMVYPEQTSTNEFLVQPSEEFLIRMRMSIPTRSLISDSNLLDPYYKIREYTDATRQDERTDYESCPDPIGCDIYFGQQYGLDGAGLVSFTTETALGESRYFRVTLYQGGSEKYVLNFTLTGSADSSAVSATPPDEKDLGFWGNLARALFVPPSNDYSLAVNNLQDTLRTKVPFGYYYALKDTYTELPLGVERPEGLVVDVPVGDSTVALDFFDFQDDNIHDAIAPFRTAMSALLWFGFGWWLLTKPFAVAREMK